ncbi:MAG: phenylalanine--tRNA ligase subunit beta [Candidatus Pacearchaeota archaeon]
MAIVTFDKKTFEKEIGKFDEKMENKISMFGTPVESEDSKEIQIEVFPNRPDLLSYHGFKRSFLSFLGKSPGMKNYSMKKPKSNFKVIVDSSVKNVRPYTSCAIVKGLKLNDNKIKEIIEVQEKLHLTVGRKRKKLAIGIYPLDKIKLPITFKAINQKEINFVPMGSTESMRGDEIIRKHPTGKEYAHLLKGMDKFPLFVDAENNVLSMPPIINSEFAGKITEKTKDVFVECSGFDAGLLKKCMIILSTMLADMGGKIYQMEIKSSNFKKEISPDFKSSEMKISINNVSKLIGLEFDESKVKTLLEKMGYNYKKNSNSVEIPSWRTDILHEVDLIEDIAIAYGYENLVPEIPSISTIGSENPKETMKRKISEIFSGLGFLEVLNYHLTNKENQLKKMGEFKKKLMEIKGSKSEYNLLRRDLSHYLLKNFSENSDSEYPQKLFEIGRVFDLEVDNVVEGENLSFGVSAGGFTEVKQTLEYLFKMINLNFKLEEPKETEEVPKYLVRGRIASVVLDGKSLGYFGEVHPRILRNWKIKMPVAICEISLKEVFEKLNQIS